VSELESGARTRLVLMGLVLVLVIAGIFWLKRRANEDLAVPGAKPGASDETETNTEIDTTPRTEEIVIDASLAPRDGASDKLVRDRAERDKLRERIYRSLGVVPPTNSRSLPPSNLAREAGTMDPAYIQARIRKDFFPLARQCYEAALERDAAAAGKLVMSFNIVGDEEVGGIVEAADSTEDSTLTDPELLYCMRESMLSMSFEPPKQGGSVTVVYPFVFSPDEPDAAKR
jgi:hypothetical protein